MRRWLFLRRPCLAPGPVARMSDSDMRDHRWPRYRKSSSGLRSTSLQANGSRERAPDDRLREAIQAYKRRLDCFVAALLAMTLKHNFSFSRRLFARGLQFHSRPKLKAQRDPQERAQATLKRGRRESRVRAAPAVSCAMCNKRNAAHEHTGEREHSGLPCAMALRLIRALLGVHAVSPSSA